MNAILIDPYVGTVETVDYNGNFHQIYDLIDAHTFDVARFNNKGDAVFVDDEGLMKGPARFFHIQGYHSPLAGKGLILGSDDEGESTAPSVSLEWARENIIFGEVVSILGEVGFIPTHKHGKSYV